MAIVSYGDIGVGANMFASFVDDLALLARGSWSSTSVKLYDDSRNYVQFTGSKLVAKTDAGAVVDITAGTVTGMKLVEDGVAVLSVTGASMSASTLGNAIFTGDDAQFLSLLLAGADTVNGTRYNDVLFGLAGNDVLNGKEGHDVLVGGAGADKLLGGSGFDIAVYVFATEGVLASLADATLNVGDAEGDTFSSIEGIMGSDFDDNLFGNAARNVLSGGAGSDLLFGGIGDDVLIGGSGEDVMEGGVGADEFLGETGVDLASYESSASGVVVSLAKPSQNSGDATGDAYTDVEGLVGSNFADRLTGDGNANAIVAGFGNDRIAGGSGDDRLAGQFGADDLFGGAGADRFLYNDLWESTVASAGRDTIFDFSRADSDRIDLHLIDARYDIPANQAFAFIGTAAFHGKAGELRYEKKASDTYIYADVNGDGKADFSIHLDDAVTLSKGSFFL
ncbi:calcium-binding protein [Rhizobium giardinii]|uniref:calcium-binding protein n=1 Tax=Rhizobium giardinii TaxID=56731 RepID=UPI0039DF7F82